MCEIGQVACSDGSKCIDEMDRCDNLPDCDDNSDEENCETTCSDDEFLCDDECYLTSLYWCDGYEDCSDGSDEQSCKFFFKRISELLKLNTC